MITPYKSSRDAILKKVRQALPQSAPLPNLDLPDQWQRFEDPFARFAEVLKSVGGHAVRVSTVSEANQHLQTLEPWIRGTMKCSVVPGVGESTFDLNSTNDPHDLERVDYAVLRGHFCVAENGAIWVTDDTLKHRVLYFIPQHISMVVPSSQMVHNMHEAYQRITLGVHRFAGFISGPSKTADIEQSLVIGAHGARSLTVYLVDELQASSAI
ncbi:MAG: lactate utilization protein C [Planctomycetota bacterium]